MPAHSLAERTGSCSAWYSARGQSPLPDESGRARFQAHLSASAGSSAPSSICTTYLPMTGKNFQPWKLPHVARKRPGAAACGEMMKSALLVKASLGGD